MAFGSSWRASASTLCLGLGLSGAVLLGTAGAADAQLTQAAADQIRALQEQINKLQQAVTELSAKQAEQAAKEAQAKPTYGLGPPAKTASGEPGEHGFLERKPGNDLTFYTPGGEFTLYGYLDVSVDATTKGFRGNPGDEPKGRTDWLFAESTNLSNVGLRGFQRLGKRPLDFVWQLETQIDITANAGAAETNSNKSNVVKGGLTTRNSFLGFASKEWGALKVGKTDAPYKTSTARMNPFSGELGDYQVVMGNTGGDNRVEFGTRLEHAIWYESPALAGFTFSALYSPGQNRASNSDNIAAGSSDCSGGNIPGSGGLVVPAPACNDGSFSDAYSASLAYSNGPLYVTAAYERHQKVNRSSDIGDLALAALDVADESAAKIGVQYTLPTKTTVSAIFEDLRRDVPSAISFQNERQRQGTWLAISQQLTDDDSIHFGWAHAFRADGDPGQHNTPGGAHVDNTANLFTAAYKHQLFPGLVWYADWAMTINGGSAHYDLGAGGRGVTTDCHDASDATGGESSNPHCFAGGKLIGFSTGVGYRF